MKVHRPSLAALGSAQTAKRGGITLPLRWNARSALERLVELAVLLKLLPSSGQTMEAAVVSFPVGFQPADWSAIISLLGGRPWPLRICSSNRVPR